MTDVPVEPFDLCPDCGTPMAASVDGMCPRCLLADGWAADDSTPSNAEGGYSLDYLRPLFPTLEIECLIARGGMGSAYLVRQKGLNRKACLKILSPSLAGNPEFVERFRLEAEAIGQLNHPNIVTVFDASQVEDVLYILMEYVDGRNLKQYSLEQSLSPDVILELLEQVASGLAVAHQRKIVHRDIKPANILIQSSDGLAKISDFGLAKLEETSLLGALTSVSLTIGTPRYMAPEQWENARGANPSSDVYSLGVVFYELATGKLPSGRFELPSKLTKGAFPRSFDQIICKALATEPAERYTDAEEMVAAVSKAKARPGKRKLTLLGTTLAVLATAGLAIGLAVSNRGDQSVASDDRIRQIPESGDRPRWNYIFTAKAEFFKGVVQEGSLGRSVAIFGDRVIAGAPEGGIKRIDTTGSGYFMVQHTQNDSTSERMEFANSRPLVIEDPDADWGDMFGYELSANAIGNQPYLAVGSPGRRRSGVRGSENSGRALIYFEEPDRKTWRRVVELGAVNRASANPALYGYAVAASGSHVVVGAPGFRSTKNSRTGAIGIYHYLEDNEWSEQWIVKPPLQSEVSDVAQNESVDFGSTVALDERFVVVGSPKDSQGQAQQGRVYIFEKKQDGNWELFQEIVDPDAKPTEQFGYRVALFQQWLLITSYSTRLGDESIPHGHVSIYRFDKQETTNGSGQWKFHQRLSVENDELRTGLKLERFGYGLAVTEKFLAVGAPTTSQHGVLHHGAVFLYKWNHDLGQWRPHTQILPRTGETRFGGAVQFGKDFLAIGSIFFPPTAERGLKAGGVFCFDLKNFEE